MVRMSPDSSGGIPEEEHQSVFEELQRCGWFVVAVLGDGHCFRRAIAKMLGHPPGYVNELMLQVLQAGMAEAREGVVNKQGVENKRREQPSYVKYLQRFSFKSRTILHSMQRRLELMQVGSLN
jgi:hypothetical protein